jgi:ABC-2 type transport system ATP-binding protein
MAAAVLEVLDLSKRYGAAVALDGVRFDVRDGEVFGLLGPNGAGKTTLLSIASGLLEASSGEVRLLGRTYTPRDRDARRLVGVVPQDLALYNDLTARENLEFFGRLYGVRGEPLRRRAGELLAAVGLADRAGDRVATYSGGMKRRLNLAAGLVHGPRLLLLDEPTVGVDPQSRNHIFEEVRRLNAAGMTVVYTSHYMEEVQALCARIGIMDRGRLVACDTLAGLLKLLPGLIRLRVAALPAGLREKLKSLAGCRLVEKPDRELELRCSDVQTTLVSVVALLQDFPGHLTALQLEEPNLERVFLHLTGRALRD